MKRQILLLAFFTVLACGSVFSQTTGKQVVKTEHTVGNFDAVSAKNGINLVLQNNNADNVVVEADGKSSKGIELKLLNGMLNISTKKTVENSKRDDSPKVYVPAKGIKRITASGGSDIYHSETIEADVLHLTVLGSSDMILDIDAREVYLTASGSADVKLTGNTGKLNINTAGSCDVDCYSLKAAEVIVVSSGSSDVYVNAKETIDIKAMGSSDIYYTGRPEFKRMEVYGSAQIHKR